MRRVIGWILAVVFMAAAPRAALPCGPGVHTREATRAWELLAAKDPAWAEAGTDPLAKSYLWLGAEGPDLQWWMSALPFGHEASLGYALLDSAAGKGPLYRMFALGHVSHQSASDASCEMFVTPTLFASAAIGHVDLFVGQDDGEGEAELVVELYGDVIVGDWLGLVDVIFDFHLDGEAADARMRDVVAWYCGVGKATVNPLVDCDAVVDQIDGYLGYADQFLGGMTRDDAKAFFGEILDKPLPDLADFIASGALTALIGKSSEKSVHHEAELARFKSGPLVDPAFWATYDEEFADLGPTWTVARIEHRNHGWPGWSPNALVCGNVQSVMRFLPEEYDPVPGLIADGLWWEDADGNGVGAVGASPAPEGTELRARVRLYSALPFQGTIRGVVRRDMPGADASGDTVAGEASLDLDADPIEYVTVPRAELVVPFSADPQGAIGFYLELYAGGSDKPWLTTNWDRLWRAPTPDFALPVYRDNHGTYGHWPHSLPVESPAAPGTTLLVKVRVAPRGEGIGGASVTLAGEPPVLVATAENGMAVFDVAPGPATFAIEAPGYVPLESGEVMAKVHEAAWADVALHAIPRIETAAYQSDPACVPFAWDVVPFGGQAKTFFGWAIATPSGEVGETDVGVTGKSKLCFASPLEEGSAVTVRLRARYVDGTDGVEGASDPVVIGEAPVPDLEPEPGMESTCEPLPALVPEPAAEPAPEAAPEPSPDVPSDAVAEVVADAAGGSGGSSGGGGCAAGAAGGGAAWTLLAGIAGLAALYSTHRGSTRRRPAGRHHDSAG